MSDSSMRKVKVKKRSGLGFNWFFWISFIVILIPCCYFIYLLWSASVVVDTPILGDRVKKTISYPIEKGETEKIYNDILALDEVDGAEVNLIVETLRISVDGKDGLGDEGYQELAKKVYDIVDKYFPINKYFTREGDYKQYDLEITVYDNLNKDDVSIVLLLKNGVMSDYYIQVLSQPLNEEIAYSLTHKEEIKTNVGESDGTSE